jgi:hypothetical protein
MGWVVVAIGAFCICGAALDWNWFINHWKSRVFLRIFGRLGARVFYTLLVAGLVVLGLFIALGDSQTST